MYLEVPSEVGLGICLKTRWRCSKIKCRPFRLRLMVGALVKRWLFYWGGDPALHLLGTMWFHKVEEYVSRVAASVSFSAKEFKIHMKRQVIGNPRRRRSIFLVYAQCMIFNGVCRSYGSFAHAPDIRQQSRHAINHYDRFIRREYTTTTPTRRRSVSRWSEEDY